MGEALGTNLYSSEITAEMIEQRMELVNVPVDQRSRVSSEALENVFIKNVDNVAELKNRILYCLITKRAETP